jgi:hypothetical protein
VGDAQKGVPNPPSPSAASASSEDIVIEEFMRQEHGRVQKQEALTAKQEEGS